MSAARSTYVGSSPPEKFAQWFDDIEAEFCPYIKPALREQSMRYRTIDLEHLGQKRSDRERNLLHEGIVLTEELRADRRRMTAEGQHLKARLLCVNLLVLGTDRLTWREAKDVVDWPHFLLKGLYTEASIMFGKFWTGEEQKSLGGRDIPSPPLAFISIRSAIRVRDPDLLQDEHFRSVLSVAREENEDVLFQKSGVAANPVSSLPSRLEDVDIYSLLRYNGGLDGD